MKKNSKIYVAGHRGLVGSAVAQKLKSSGFKNLILKTHQELDLLDGSQVRNFFERFKPEYVIDAAARVGGIKDNLEHQADFLFENMQIQNNLIWQAHLSGVKKFLFLGSSCIYPRECAQPMKEEYLLTGRFEPTNEGYAVAKIAGAKLCKYIYSQYGQIFISLMPCNLYGPNDSFDLINSHVIPALIRKFYEAKISNIGEITLWGSGSARREFLYIDDLADALFFLMDNYNDPDIINIGTGQDISIKQLAIKIKNIVGFRGKIVWNKSKPDGMPRKLLAVDRIHNLGWRHKIDLDEGLNRTITWFIKNYKEL